MGPSSDSDQDDDTISQSGRSEWEYPTVKSNIGNYDTIKVVPSTPSNSTSSTQIKSSATTAPSTTTINNGVSIISINGTEKNDNYSHNYQNSISSSSTSSSSSSSISNKLSIKDNEHIKKTYETNYQQTNDIQPNDLMNINYSNNNIRKAENNLQQQTYSVRLKYQSMWVQSSLKHIVFF